MVVVRTLIAFMFLGACSTTPNAQREVDVAPQSDSGTQPDVATLPEVRAPVDVTDLKRSDLPNPENDTLVGELAETHGGQDLPQGEIVPSYCVDDGEIAHIASSLSGAQCKTLDVDWVTPLRLTLCLSSKTLHQGGCGPFGQFDLLVAMMVEPLTSGEEGGWSGALVAPELWTQSGVYLQSLTFVKVLTSPCPIYFLNGPGHGTRLLSLDSTLRPLTLCPDAPDSGFNAVNGGCRFNDGYLRPAPSQEAIGMVANLPPGNYEIRLVFCPSNGGGPCSWSPDRCVSELGEDWWPQLGWPPQQQWVSMGFEVVE